MRVEAHIACWKFFTIPPAEFVLLHALCIQQIAVCAAPIIAGSRRFEMTLPKSASARALQEEQNVACAAAMIVYSRRLDMALPKSAPARALKEE